MRYGSVNIRPAVLREVSTLEQEDLLHHCRERLTGYKVPKYLEFRASLSKTSVGKILRRALAEEESSRAQSAANQHLQAAS